MTEGYSDWQGVNKYTFADGQTGTAWYDGSDNFIGDGLTELLPEDDAATVNWGSQWQMPSIAQFHELIDNTTQEEKELNGILGTLYTGTNGNSIFLPNAGYYDGTSIVSSDCYLTRETSSCSDFAGTCSYGVVGNQSRRYGCTIRPVRKP